MRVLGGALLGLAAIAAAAFAVVSTLPAPRVGDRVAVRVLERLQDLGGTGGVVRLAGVSMRVTCRRVRPSRRIASLSDGTRLVISGTRTRTIEPARARMLAAAVHAPELAAAEADLAGSYDLYERELTGRLLRGAPVVSATRLLGTPAYRLALGRGRPAVALFVDRATLTPLAATYHSASLAGRVVLAKPVRRLPDAC